MTVLSVKLRPRDRLLAALRMRPRKSAIIRALSMQ
jgi:hypothetical protein